ncbi:MAG TPA: response regulator [Flavihumibacter sp.]|nr:response regulator [Bacteroidota bacterium]HOA38294.1 response regulator [Flavihumibacter sp.]HPZ87598.1 response regulator [Flavihumibacter sp.]HQD08940.1 response regulator [Flavihumibacter sp.]
MKRKILVITESKAIRFLLQTVLHDDYTTVTAAEAGEAVHHISKGDLPAAIVIDPELPDTEPWELVEHFRTSGLYQHIPMLVISSRDEEEISKYSLDYGIEAAFKKPFNPIDLKQRLDALVKAPNTADLAWLKVV